jgi:ubiquinone/menaquinone biosynthesis C-methylase UbiE
VSFDRVAPFYRTLEWLVFGDQLQRARVAFLAEIETPSRVLITGEGDGRFLADFVRQYPDAEVDCVDASERMIALARSRLGAGHRVTFIHADIRDRSLPPQHYDLIVTHFFLDCFTEEVLSTVVSKLADSATSDAQWLIADFCEPPRGWRRLWTRWLIPVMYGFFRLVAGIEGRRLVEYGPLLRAHGFSRTLAMFLPNELVRSERWRRNPSG